VDVNYGMNSSLNGFMSRCGRMSVTPQTVQRRVNKVPLKLHDAYFNSNGTVYNWRRPRDAFPPPPSYHLASDVIMMLCEGDGNAGQV